MDISQPEVEQDCTEEEAEARRIMESDTYKIAIALGWKFDKEKRRFHGQVTWIDTTTGKDGGMKNIIEMAKWIESPAGTEAMKRKLESIALKRAVLRDLSLAQPGAVPLEGPTHIGEEIAGIRRSRVEGFKPWSRY